MSFKNEAEAMLTGINVDMMNETVWTDYLVWSLWSDTVDGDCHLYPVVNWEYVTWRAMREEISQGQWCCAQSCPTLWGPLDCSFPSSSVNGTFFFFRQEYWSRLPFPPPQDLPDSGIKPMSLASAALSGRFFTTKLPGKPQERGVACPKMEQ